MQLYLQRDGEKRFFVTRDFGTDSRCVTTNQVFSNYIHTDYLWEFLMKCEAFATLLINSTKRLCSKLAVNGVIM
jgi:hypothetical protein